MLSEKISPVLTPRYVPKGENKNPEAVHGGIMRHHEMQKHLNCSVGLHCRLEDFHVFDVVRAANLRFPTISGSGTDGINNLINDGSAVFQVDALSLFGRLRSSSHIVSSLMTRRTF